MTEVSYVSSDSTNAQLWRMRYRCYPAACFPVLVREAFHQGDPLIRYKSQRERGYQIIFDLHGRIFVHTSHGRTDSR